MAENVDNPVVFEPDDVGQQEEAPEGHMQPRNNAENDEQHHVNNDFIIPPDVDPLPENVDHWVRRSTCIRHNVSRYDPSLHYIMLTDEGEPLTYREAKACEHNNKWELAMQEEIKALHSNNTWDLVELPKAKGYAKTKGIDFQEVFSLVVKMATLQVLFAIVAALDLERDQMDVHTTFLHGHVEEELYMKHSEGFVIRGKEHLVSLARLCSEFGLPDRAPMLGCDSQSAICLAKNAMFHARTKHIDVRYHFIREVLEDNLITLVKVHTSQNPTDVLTKCLPKAQHQLCIEMVGVT
ncbi:hypothetical protein KP509_21G045900 [Ceratopteris richardii]|uniref:Reverse transcriptase Ty1/copia-type domain-containing protein n=1 Tax=Ceratopteris richardii TaxID=49495 RepID=A0A8T2SAZ1_CERRI|nr:hypothetical protein KP509_21G045900 [Ceratopteris richardii]